MCLMSFVIDISVPLFPKVLPLSRPHHRFLPLLKVSHPDNLWYFGPLLWLAIFHRFWILALHCRMQRCSCVWSNVRAFIYIWHNRPNLIDISTTFEKIGNNIKTASIHWWECYWVRNCTVNGAGICDICAVLNYQFHNFEGVFVACVVERGVAPTISDIRVCAMLEKLVDHICVFHLLEMKQSASDRWKSSQLLFDYHSDVLPLRSWKLMSHPYSSRAHKFSMNSTLPMTCLSIGKPWSRR